MACVTICASSMAASAGLSQPLLDNTSTQAWISRIAWKTRDGGQVKETVTRGGDAGRVVPGPVVPC